MLADFLMVIPQTKLMVLVTARPEYEGALTRVHGAQTIAPCPNWLIRTPAALLIEQLGSDPSVGELAVIIAEAGRRETRSSPRRWCASWCSAGCWPVSAVAMSVARTPPKVTVPATVQAAIAGAHRPAETSRPGGR